MFGKRLNKVFQADLLNDFMALTRDDWSRARAKIIKLLQKENKSLQGTKKLRQHLLVPISVVEMHLPARIGDYTDFYASMDHAKNVGTMFRDANNPLLPNWKHIPVGYHGRASSVIVSGTPVKRPTGQKVVTEGQPPVYAPCSLLDVELEVGAFVGGPENDLGTPITVDNVEDRLFGLVLLNDWSARDIQKWEYVPLGPFCAKNFASTISPSVVTMEALKPFITGPVYEHDPAPLPYLQDPKEGNYDIKLEIQIKSPQASGFETISVSNMKYLYWTFKQQLVHHSSTGCNMRAGDLLGSGTISGPTADPQTFGSMLEITWRGSKPLKLETGEERKFIADGDTIRLTGHGETPSGARIGFGECDGIILPANK